MTRENEVFELAIRFHIEFAGDYGKFLKLFTKSCRFETVVEAGVHPVLSAQAS
jgi:hypothetical protein